MCDEAQQVVHLAVRAAEGKARGARRRRVGLRALGAAQRHAP